MDSFAPTTLMRPRRKVTSIQVLLIVVLLLGITAINVARLMVNAPTLDELVYIDSVLLRPIEVMRANGRGSGGPWASVTMDGITGRIDDLCFLWDCNLPEALAGLGAGDPIRVWMRDGEIWQVADDSGMALRYAQAVDGRRRAWERKIFVFGGVATAFIGILSWIWMRRR